MKRERGEQTWREIQIIAKHDVEFTLLMKARECLHKAGDIMCDALTQRIRRRYREIRHQS